MIVSDIILSWDSLYNNIICTFDSGILDVHLEGILSDIRKFWFLIKNCYFMSSSNKTQFKINYIKLFFSCTTIDILFEGYHSSILKKVAWILCSLFLHVIRIPIHLKMCMVKLLSYVIQTAFAEFKNQNQKHF